MLALRLLRRRSASAAFRVKLAQPVSKPASQRRLSATRWVPPSLQSTDERDITEHESDQHDQEDDRDLHKESIAALPRQTAITASPDTWSNSRRLAVANGMSWAKAVAAIHRSCAPIMLPCASSCAQISA